ncbi:hypothetical protein [Actinomadura gamaensis]|uniref:Uncharacterized protein n=1 Tax=Actinomadura gamaensis TaxID=1763541 RepID=A0ABV9U7V9_9ACTN
MTEHPDVEHSVIVRGSNEGIIQNVPGGGNTVSAEMSVASQPIPDGLADELARLAAAMRERADGLDQDRAVVAVGEAAEAARRGDAAGVAARLRSAGRWAWEVARAIGAELAAAVIVERL